MVEENSRARSVLIVGAKSGMLYALDPENQGKIVWSSRCSLLS